jgi:hypothetical protein
MGSANLLGRKAGEPSRDHMLLASSERCWESVGFTATDQDPLIGDSFTAYLEISHDSSWELQVCAPPQQRHCKQQLLVCDEAWRAGTRMAHGHGTDVKPSVETRIIKSGGL